MGTKSTDLETTLIYIEENLLKRPWSLSFPKGLFPCLHYPLSSSNGFCDEKGKRDSLATKAKGPWQRNVV